jgi:hypothetical protein
MTVLPGYINLISDFLDLQSCLVHSRASIHQIFVTLFELTLSYPLVPRMYKPVDLFTEFDENCSCLGAHTWMARSRCSSEVTPLTFKFRHIASSTASNCAATAYSGTYMQIW